MKPETHRIQIEPIALGVEDAAALVALSPETLNDMRIHGGGPPFKKVGRRVVYTPAGLRAWVEGLPSFTNTTEVDLAKVKP